MDEYYENAADFEYETSDELTCTDYYHFAKRSYHEQVDKYGRVQKQETYNYEHCDCFEQIDINSFKSTEEAILAYREREIKKFDYDKKLKKARESKDPEKELQALYESFDQYRAKVDSDCDFYRRADRAFNASQELETQIMQIINAEKQRLASVLQEKYPDFIGMIKKACEDIEALKTNLFKEIFTSLTKCTSEKELKKTIEKIKKQLMSEIIEIGNNVRKSAKRAKKLLEKSSSERSKK